MSHTLSLAAVVEMLEKRYPPGTAEEWDAVGLVAGDPTSPVRRVMFAVDPVLDVVTEAEDRDVDLLITHHPLYLRGTTTVAATGPKGQVIHRLITAGCGLYTAHTNADVAIGGVNDALADLFDLQQRRPLRPHDAAALDSWVTYVPPESLDEVIDAMSAAGAGRLGNYERCAFTTTGYGTFLPVGEARPTIGEVGSRTVTPEERLEMVAPPHRRSEVLGALRAAHPYEEPAFTVVTHAPQPADTGLGRIGNLPRPMTLREFADLTARMLPATPQGLRVSGDLDAEVRTVAVCGGSGDSLLGTVAGLGADVYLTADLRHHPASEAREQGRPFLVDATHWASEWPWLPAAAEQLRQDAANEGAELEVIVSTTVTDPWTMTLPTSHNDLPVTNDGAAS